MSAASGDRLGDGQVVAGILNVDPRSSEAAHADEREDFDEVPNVFVYATGEDLLAELGSPNDHQNAAQPTGTVTGRRHLSLWERMLEALDLDFARTDPGIDAGQDEEIDEGDTRHDRDPDGTSDDKANADRDRPRSGLRATLGELVGASKQGGRHAR